MMCSRLQVRPALLFHLFGEGSKDHGDAVYYWYLFTWTSMYEVNEEEGKNDQKF